MHWEDRLRALAATQDGVVGIDQLEIVGCSGKQWGRARENGRWSAPSRRVLTMRGTPPSPGQRVHAGIQDAGGGAVLHGGSTLAWCGLRGFDLSDVHVTRRRGGRAAPAELARVHRLRDLSSDEICVVRGVPTVRPLRAIWSEASRYSNERWFDIGVQRIGELLDDANRAGLVTWAELHSSLEELQRCGRSGTRVLREVASARPPGSAVTESRNEDRFEAVLDRHGLAPMLRQVVVGGAGPIGRADHRDPDLPLVAETNSVAFHSLPSDQANDERRYAAMVDAGFTVAVIWEHDVWSRPGNVAETVRQARRVARSGAPGVVHSASCPWPADHDRVVIRTGTPGYRG